MSKPKDDISQLAADVEHFADEVIYMMMNKVTIYKNRLTWIDLDSAKRMIVNRVNEFIQNA